MQRFSTYANLKANIIKWRVDPCTGPPVHGTNASHCFIYYLSWLNHAKNCLYFQQKLPARAAKEIVWWKERTDGGEEEDEIHLFDLVKSSVANKEKNDCANFVFMQSISSRVPKRHARSWALLLSFLFLSCPRAKKQNNPHRWIVRWSFLADPRVNRGKKWQRNSLVLVADVDNAATGRTCSC
jgi:hypothetical protein